MTSAAEKNAPRADFDSRSSAEIAMVKRADNAAERVEHHIKIDQSRGGCCP